MYKIKVYGKTDKGIRKNNEDSFAAFSTPDSTVVAVADGMGGHIGGKTASKSTVVSVEEFLKGVEFTKLNDSEVSKTMINAVRQVQKNLKAMAEKDSELADMGTTLNLNVFAGKKLFTLNIGDSRCSHFSKKKLVQISEDHNLASLAQQGKIDKKYLDHTNYLTSSLGPNKETKVDFFVTELSKAGKVIVSSDGVHQFVSEIELTNILKSKMDLETKTSEAVRVASENKSNDNMTIVVVEYGK